MANNIFLPPTQEIPKFLTVSAVTQGYPMVVTVVESNLYIALQSMRFSIPPSYGMTQLDGLTGNIIQITGQNFYFNIDSSVFDPFVIPVPGVKIEKPATISSAGSNNLQYNNNISFNVAFQNLNNIGN